MRGIRRIELKWLGEGKPRSPSSLGSKLVHGLFLMVGHSEGCKMEIRAATCELTGRKLAFRWRSFQKMLDRPILWHKDHSIRNLRWKYGNLDQRTAVR